MRLGIKVKCILLSLITTVGSVLILTMYLFNQFMDSYEQQITDQHSQLLKQLSYNLDTYMDEIYRLAYVPYCSSDFLEQLKKEPKDLKGTLQKQREIESYIKSAMIYPRKDINSVIMVSGNIYVYGNYSETTSIEDTKLTDWYQKAADTKQPVILLKKDNFSVANAIWDMNRQEYLIGVVRVDASFSTIRNLCNSVNFGQESGVAILSQNGDVVYKTMSDEKLDFVKSWDSDGENRREGNFLINKMELQNFGLQLVSYDSMDGLRTKLNETRKICVILVIIISMIMAALLYRFMTWFFSPMYGMIAIMKRIEQGEIDLRYRESGRKDEIEYLGITFNSMLDRVKEMTESNSRLNEQIYSFQLLQRNLQLQLLYGQIRPHFIYNVLNSISIQVQCGQGDDAVKTINQFSLLLRGVAYINQTIELGMELTLVESYLGLQKIRFGQRLNYTVEVDEKAHKNCVPTLILQPIIENAIVHGCEETNDELFVRISGKYSDEALIISISDDGQGIAEEELEKIRKKISSDVYRDIGFVEDLSKVSGLGLVNVNERIRMYYGNDYGLQIDSEYGKGTTVRVILPSEISM